MASNSRKRSAPEVDNYTDVTEPFQTANVHGVLKALSPVKKGKTCKYFDGVLTDGTSTMRLVGFRQDQQKRLFTFSENKTPVSLQDCQIKVSRQGNQMEALLKNGTKIFPSTKKFDIPEGDEADASVVITLAKVQETELFNKVSTSVKVLHKKDPIQIPGGKTKQDVIVGDSTSTTTVSLWEEYVDAMTPDLSYCLQNFVVREFNMKKFLSMPREGATIVAIGDIGEVEHESDSSEFENCLQDVQIVGVPQLHSYNACLQCKARVEPLTPPLGRCSKPDCGMIQRFDICTSQVSAKLLLMYSTGGSDTRQYKSLHAFGSTVKQLANVLDGEATATDLLATAPFETIKYNDKNVITAFTRQ